MREIPRSLPGRKCAWCGGHGGAGFTALVRSLMAAGVEFKYLLTPFEAHIHYLHPNCARAAQKAIPKAGYMLDPTRAG